MKKISILSSLWLLFSCAYEPIFTQLHDNHINLVFKGTYESNGPYKDKSIYLDDSVDGDAANTDTTNPTYSLHFIYDIAEMKIGNSDQEDKDKHPLVSERFVIYTSYMGANDHRFLENGIDFDGTKEQFSLTIDDRTKTFETTYTNNDVYNGHFDELDVFFRKYIAQPVTISGTETETLRDFQTVGTDDDNHYLDGYDSTNAVIEAQTDYYGTMNGYNLESFYGSYSSLFPLRISTNITIEAKKNYILEVRIPFRNCVSILEYDLYGDDKSEILFPGFSDIKSKLSTSVDEGTYDPLNHSIIGGARIYEIDNVGQIAGTSEAGYDYVIAIPSGDDINNYLERTEDTLPYLPLVATKGGSTFTLENIPPGSYDIYEVKDTNNNCFPDSAKAYSNNPVSVERGQTTTGIVFP